MPEVERVYRAWGYPLVPVLFLLTTAWLLITTLYHCTVRSLIGIGLVALGLPVYYYQSRVAQNHDAVSDDQNSGWMTLPIADLPVVPQLAHTVSTCSPLTP